MKKIFIPCEKKEASARGFWKSADGRKCKDFIRFIEADNVTVKELKNLCKQYKQEAIFYVSINNKTKRQNTATCFYANGKIEKFNKIINHVCYSKKELKEDIRYFTKRDYTCYTIEKTDYGFILYTWTNKIDKKKRLVKRNRLIKDLFIQIKKITGYNYNIPCNISIRKKSRVNYNRLHTKRAIFQWDEIAIQNKIVINPDLLRYIRIYSGYKPDNYYIGRHTKINPLILHNYKKCLRFVILHELGHATFNCKHTKAISGSRYKIARLEKYADNFAIRYLPDVLKIKV